MGPLRIAPYLGQNVQQSYLRQQRVGERIAGDKTKPARKPDPAAEVAISSQAREAAELPHEEANQPHSAQIDQLAEEFVYRFLFESENTPAGTHSGASTEEGDFKRADAQNISGGRTAFVRLLESYGFTIQQDELGADEAIVSQETGDIVVRLTAEKKDVAKNELLALTRDILSSIF